MSRTTAIRCYAAAVAVVLALIAHSEFTTPLPTRKPDVQATMFSQVPTAQPGPPPVATRVREGRALLYIRIPRFGQDWIWTVVEGVSLDDLALGPGHYPTTPLPGEVGNTAIAGHRAGHGDPFIDFDSLEVGDKVVLAQNGGSWTYTITAPPKIIEPDEDWVLDRYKTGRTLTLTTCWPRYGSSKRMFVRADLTASTRSVGGSPPP
jgi:sortase A